MPRQSVLKAKADLAQAQQAIQQVERALLSRSSS
jgi:hypothetical protein